MSTRDARAQRSHTMRARTMLRTVTLALAMCLAAPPLASAQTPGAAAPPPPSVKVGDTAPDFTANYLTAADANGKRDRKAVKLSEFRGQKNVVLAFFPAAFSTGCTSEVAKYRESAGEFNSNNTVILGMSVESIWANVHLGEVEASRPGAARRASRDPARDALPLPRLGYGGPAGRAVPARRGAQRAHLGPGVCRPQDRAALPGARSAGPRRQRVVAGHGLRHREPRRRPRGVRRSSRSRSLRPGRHVAGRRERARVGRRQQPAAGGARAGGRRPRGPPSRRAEDRRLHVGGDAARLGRGVRDACRGGQPPARRHPVATE